MNQFCEQCGAKLAAGSRFCEQCGAAVKESPPPDASAVRLQKVRQLFDGAVALPTSEREARLAQAGQSDPELVAEVRGLLAEHEASIQREPASIPADLTPTRMPPPAAPSAPTSSVGPYRVIRELGRGGMGVVYLAVRDDGAFRKNVALKVLLKDKVSDEFVLRFRQERQVLASLDHPNIARIIDGGDTSDKVPFYVMDYVEGLPIEQYCEQQRLSLADRIRLFQQVCQAVQYLHEHLIVHRDLKPSNIMVSNEGAVKLLDFGIAKLLVPASLSGAADLTGAQGQPLTPNYASPEQIAGGAAQKTSDVYALGVILYRLLTGQTPYEGLEDRLAGMRSGHQQPLPSQNIREELRNTPETTAQLRRRMIGDLDQIVLMAMRLDPRERYQSAAEFAGDLQHYLDGQPVRARKISFASRSARLLKRKWVAAAAVIAFLALAGLSGWQWMRIQKQTSEVAAREADVRKLLESLEGRANVQEDAAKRSAFPGGAASEVKEAPAPADTTEKTKDVHRLRDALEKQLTPALATRPGMTPDRKAFFDRVAGYLDKIRPLSAGNPDLSLELAAAYQQLGVLQESASGSKAAAGSGALASYRTAQALLNDVSGGNANDPRVNGRMAFLSRRIAALGGGTPVTPPAEPIQVKTPPAPAPVLARAVKPPAIPPARPRTASAPPPAARHSAAPPPAQPQVSAEQMHALEDQLVSVTIRIRIAEQAIEPLRQSLAQTNQTLNPDVASAMIRMRSQLEKAKRDLASGNVASAQESLRVADGLAAKVLKSVGR